MKEVILNKNQFARDYRDLRQKDLLEKYGICVRTAYKYLKMFNIPLKNELSHITIEE